MTPAGTLRGKLWLNLSVASREYGIPTSTLRRWCDQGSVRCRKVGRGHGHWQVLDSSMRKLDREEV